MTKRILFRKTSLLKNVSKRRVFAAISLGLIFSLVFYAFLLSLRETLRIQFSIIIDPNFLLQFSAKEAMFYDYVFAVFSSILGLSLTLKTIFEKPKQFKSDDNYYFRKSMVFTDASLLHFSFLAVSIRIVFISIATFGSVFPHYLSYYDDYKFLIYLALIVLFLEQWKTIRLIFKNKALKWMLVSLLSILLYSFLISQINIIDYKKIDKQILINQPLYNYHLNLPKFKNYKKNYRKSLTPELYVAYKKGEINHSESPVIVYNLNEFTIDNISEIMVEIKNMYHEYDLPWVTFKLNIDKDIKMLHVNKLKTILAENGYLKIAYGVIEKGSEWPKELFPVGAFEKLREVKNINNKPLPPPLPIIEKENLFIIKLKNDKNFIINGKADTINKNAIKKFILKSPKTNVIQIELEDESTLSEYLYLKDILISIYVEIRDEYTMNVYNAKMIELNQDQIREVKILFPQIIWLKEK